jgi:hypothetical protein
VIQGIGAVRSLAFVCLVAVGAACDGRLSLDNSGGSSSPGELPPLSGDHPTVGLVSAAGGPGMLLAEWRTPVSVADDVQLALFVGPDSEALFAAEPVPVARTSGHRVVRGLALDVRQYVGLGIRTSSSEPYLPSGPVLTVSTRAPVFVDVSADPALGDGLTPETAFNDLLLGVLIASSHGRGNVWVAGGVYPNTSLPIYTGVSVLGGFTDATQPPGKQPLRPTRKGTAQALDDDQFAQILEARDPFHHPTRLLGADGQAIATLEDGVGGPAVLDGLVLDGGGISAAGVDDTARPLELRSVAIQRCQRGVKLRPTPGMQLTRVVMTGVSTFGCDLEGISVDGVFDLTIEASQSVQNQNEGLDLNALVAPDGTTARLVLRGSSFDSNGTEGVEVHLAAPAGGGLLGGTFDVLVQDCDFTRNGLDGLGIDIDYEAFPLWHSNIVVRGVRARDNRASGVYLDVDARATVLIHRLASSANAQDGLLVASESFPGTVTVSASSLMGNLGAGIRAGIGNVGVIASHCAIAGNGEAGFVSEVVPSLAVSTIAYLQPNPRVGSASHYGVTQEIDTPPPFQRAPREFARAVAASASQLVLEHAPTSGSGSIVEVADDDLARTASAIAGNTVVVAPALESVVLPSMVAFFDGPLEAGVVDDLRLTPNSSALGAGMAPPGRAAVDAGPFAAPLGGTPGRESQLPPALFYVGSIEPPWTAPVDFAAELRLAFVGGEPDLVSALSTVFVVDAFESSLPITLFVEDGHLVVAPPLGGWNGDEVLELCAGLRSTAGVELASPVAIPLRVR